MYYTFLRQRFSAAGAFHDCTDLSSASNPFQHFKYISPHGVRTSFANHSIHRQQRRRTVPRAFFLVLINSEECTAIVETDRDFADRNPPPHSSRNIRNHSIYLSGTALCGAINAYERPAAEGLVKLARLCVAPCRDRSAVPDFTSHCNFSTRNRVNNKDKGRIRPAAVLYRERGRSSGPPVLISKIINERRRHNRAAEGAWRTYPSL